MNAKPNAKPKDKRIPVSDSNVRKAAARLLSHALVTPEILYVQQTLGTTATQVEIDEKVVLVRKLPWESIVVAD